MSFFLFSFTLKGAEAHSHFSSLRRERRITSGLHDKQHIKTHVPHSLESRLSSFHLSIPPCLDLHLIQDNRNVRARLASISFLTL